MNTSIVTIIVYSYGQLSLGHSLKNIPLDNYDLLELFFLFSAADTLMKAVTVTMLQKQAVM